MQGCSDGKKCRPNNSSYMKSDVNAFKRKLNSGRTMNSSTCLQVKLVTYHIDSSANNPLNEVCPKDQEGQHMADFMKNHSNRAPITWLLVDNKQQSQKIIYNYNWYAGTHWSQQTAVKVVCICINTSPSR